MMIVVVLLWAAVVSMVGALPLSGVVGERAETVCETEGGIWTCLSSHLRSTIRTERAAPGFILYARSLVARQDDADSSSHGPALGTILGAVFGAIGGIAIAGAIFYAWWSIRRVRQQHASRNPGGSSSFGPGAHTSRHQHSSGESSSASRSKKSKTYKGGSKWQDPWLAPAPKPSRTVPVKLDVVVGPTREGGAGNDVQDDRGSESSAVPLKVIYTNDQSSVRTT